MVAEFDPNQFAAMRSLIDSSSGGAGGKSKGSVVLHLAGLGTGQDVDCFVGLSSKGKGFNSDKTAPVINFGKPNGICASIIQALKSDGVWSGLQKVAQAGAPKQINSMADIMGQPVVNTTGGNTGPAVNDGGGGINI